MCVEPQFASAPSVRRVTRCAAHTAALWASACPDGRRGLPAPRTTNDVCVCGCGCECVCWPGGGGSMDYYTTTHTGPPTPAQASFTCEFRQSAATLSRWSSMSANASRTPASSARSNAALVHASATDTTAAVRPRTSHACAHAVRPVGNALPCHAHARPRCTRPRPPPAAPCPRATAARHAGARPPRAPPRPQRGRRPRAPHLRSTTPRSPAPRPSRTQPPMRVRACARENPSAAPASGGAARARGP